MTVPALTADLAPAPDDIDQRCVTTIRMLAVDAVEAANSGHPGLPMGAAAPVWALWRRHLRYDPADPTWPDRDRFVLSAGHGSMLLYAMLHLSGYGLGLDELRAFRQWGSRTPGHPEHGHTPGVETTTGPLGQGFATAVGMALAERMLAARFNQPGLPPLVDHRTFVLASDGDLMEGVSHEAASLAGHLGLGRLIVLFDDNHITIDGPTTLAFGEDVATRFRGYGWHVQRVDDGNDLDAVDAALDGALAQSDAPSLIAVRTTIGFGAPTKAGSSVAHGAPLGADEVAAVRERFAWPAEPFHVPADVRTCFEALAALGGDRRRAWEDRLRQLRDRRPDLGAEWDRVQRRALPAGALDDLPSFEAGSKPVATRVASGKALTAIAARVPDVVGGSADLAGSTNVDLPAAISRDGFDGQQIHFGVREHGMAAALNGLALHGLRPFGSTFLVFSDYLRPALRLSALMRQPVVYVFTHDSIGLGEDGPTHQPIEHLAALRAMPNLAVLRPADANETVEAWRLALGRTGPTALVLTRQGLPVLPASPAGWMGAQGARVVRDGRDAGADPDVVLIATGSEVSLALEAADALAGDRIVAQVVSMPWRERFCALPAHERAAMLGGAVPRLAIEAGVPQGWECVVGDSGAVLGLDDFGASAPGPVAMANLGFTPERVARAALDLLG